MAPFKQGEEQLAVCCIKLKDVEGYLTQCAYDLNDAI